MKLFGKHLYPFLLCIFAIGYVECLSDNEIEDVYKHSMDILNNGASSFGDIQYALSQLKRSAESYEHVPSLRALAEVSLFGNFSNAPDFHLAKSYLSKLAEYDTSGRSHFYLAWIEDEGLLDVRNPEKVHPGRSWPRVKLDAEAEDAQGLAGEDLMQYYHLTAAADTEIKNLLGQLYFFGANGVELDYPEARIHFERAADDGSPIAFGFLGMMYLYGMGVQVDYQAALSYFRHGAELNHPLSWDGLGLLYSKGLGVRHDPEEAANCFTKAADLDSVDAHYHLAQIYLARPSSSGLRKIKAINHLQISASNGNIKALQELGKLKYMESSEISCQETKKYFKIIAERMLGYLVHEAYQDYHNGYPVMATIKYMLASFVGFETAQHNSAYLLEQSGSENGYSRALSYLIRAADQGDLQARVRAGDYYYYGYGIPMDYSMAAKMYSVAYDAFNPQASFSLGYLYEYGLGVPKDFSIAKKYYERTVDFNPKSWLPVRLALYKMYIKTFWESDVPEGTRNGEGAGVHNRSSYSQGQKHRQQWFFSSLLSWISSYRWIWSYIQRIILSLLLLLTIVHYARNIVQVWRFGHNQVQEANENRGQLQMDQLERVNREEAPVNDDEGPAPRPRPSRPLSVYYNRIQQELDSQSKIRRRIPQDEQDDTSSTSESDHEQ